MYKIQGISVTSGIAIGNAKLIKQRSLNIEDHQIAEEQINTERERFQNSITAVISEIEQYEKNFELTDEDLAIIETHKMILLDPDFTATVDNLITNEQKNLELAINIHFTRTIEYFKSLENEIYAERSIDYEDVYRRLIMQIKKIDVSVLDEINMGEIVVANDIPPSTVSQLHRKGIFGIVLERGAKTSHTVIIARALGLPIITGIKYMHSVHDGDVLILDARNGVVIGNPHEHIYSEFIEMQKRIKVEVNELIDYIDLMPSSANCEKLKILTNIDLPMEILQVLELKTDGIGLFRTESFYLNRQNLPTEEEQFTEYKILTEKLGSKPFVVRTIDIGGDKVAGWYSLDKEANPYLGCRGIRFSLRYPNIFKTQIRAILRASAFGNMSIMFPMVATTEEIVSAREIIDECKKQLRSKGIAFNNNIQIGTMIETPSAAICIDGLARVSDFFSIGTNDLLQYTVAADRNNEKLAIYYNPFNPAFLTLVLQTINSAKRNNVPIAICGELAANELFTAFFLNAGVRELSVGIDHTLKLKKHIRSIDASAGVNFINQLYECTTIAETIEYINRLNHICVAPEHTPANV